MISKQVDHFGASLEALRALHDGWLDGEGVAPDKQSLQRLVRNIETHFDAEISLPYIYPTAEGGVQAEWTFGAWEISIDLDLRTQYGDYQAVNLDDQAVHEWLLDLDSPEGWKALNALLKQFEVST